METLCGFLNTDGGIIFIGVNQNGKLVGCTVSDRTQQEIANEMSKVEPFSHAVHVQYLPVEDDRQLIIISTRRGNCAPYTYDGRAYYRNQSCTMRMNQTLYRQQLAERNAHPPASWEMQTVPDMTIDDLDHDEIKQVIEIAVRINRLGTEALDESINVTLSKLDLIDKDERLTQAGVTLFAKSMPSHFSQCAMRLACFRGRSDLDEIIDNQHIRGNAFQLMKAANQFIMRYLPVTSLFEASQFERIDRPLVPVLAIREALCNAICHKDYTVPNSEITLGIFDDRMEIWNCGYLPSALTLADLKKKHKSYLRNPKIARVFYLRRYVESWGTGTTRMFTYCDESECPEPEFEQYSGGFAVTFKFREALPGRELPKPAKEEAEVALTTLQKEILALIKKNKIMKTTDIVSQLSVDISLRVARKNLNILKKNGLISLEGMGPGSLWHFISNGKAKSGIMKNNEE